MAHFNCSVLLTKNLVLENGTGVHRMFPLPVRERNLRFWTLPTPVILISRQYPWNLSRTPRAEKVRLEIRSRATLRTRQASSNRPSRIDRRVATSIAPGLCLPTAFVVNLIPPLLSLLKSGLMSPPPNAKLGAPLKYQEEPAGCNLILEDVVCLDSCAMDMRRSTSGILQAY